MKSELHPWLSTPEASDAARKAIRIPLVTLRSLAIQVGEEELVSEAMIILAECALHPRDQFLAQCAKCGGSLKNVRKGAKFCSPNCRKQYAVNVQRSKTKTLPPVPQSHIGSMWGWPESERAKYTVKVVGYALNNWLRTQHRWSETPASEYLANMNIPVPDNDDQSAYEFLTEFLESKGLKVTGDESFEELATAAINLKGRDGSMIAAWLDYHSPCVITVAA